MTDTKQWEGHHGPILDQVNGFDVIDCETCGFKHVVPIPTPEELEAVYRQDYYTNEKPLYLERAREDLDWWNLIYSDRYDTFEANLPPNRRHILDVGSGPGFFLKHGRDRGWTVHGIEPSSQAAGHARGLDLPITEALFSEETADGLGQFDVIHMRNVLEHISDPTAFLNLAKRCLSMHGIICVVVPNDYSPFQIALTKVYDYQPWWVSPPHHLNYFDIESLSQLFERCGFDVIDKESEFPIDLFLLMGVNYVGNDQIGRDCHKKRKLFETCLMSAGFNELKRDLYRSLANLGIGREICLYGRLR